MPCTGLEPVRLEADKGSVILSAAGQRIRFDGHLFQLDVEPAVAGEWSAEPGELLILRLVACAGRPALLRQVRWFAGVWEDGIESVVHRTALQDNALFLRKGGVSFFLSLDFPFSTITAAGIGYPPNRRLAAGEAHACHTLSIGACRLSGVKVGAFDRAEIEAYSAYIERRFPIRFERPMVVSAGITNRMTECREGRIFYNLEDNPTVSMSPDLVEADIRVMAELGVEYLQVFEGGFDWPDADRTPRNMRQIMAAAREHGVKVGDYVVPEGPHVPHYNYSGRRQERLEWRKGEPDGRRADYSCLGCKGYVDYLLERLVAHNREFGEQLICLDGLCIQPCHATDHGHLPGDVYAQVAGLVRLMEALAALDPDFLVWSNAGNWREFMPKLVWFNPNVYLTDPAVRDYASTLNQLKLLGDGRREQMVTVHEQLFVPYRCFCNYEYYCCPRSRVPDRRVYEYSFLQSVAVTPNIAVGEVRTFLDHLPSVERAWAVAFMRKWIVFLREHFGEWKQTLRVGDPPGIGATEIYAHPAAEGTNVFVCLVNQNPFPRRARFRLDGSIGLRVQGPLRIRELYPRECPVAGQALPAAAPGDELVFELPPHSVQFLAVEPAPPPADLQVLGHPVRAERAEAGYRLTLRAPQGETVRLGLILPPGERLESVRARQAPSVPMYEFPVAVSVAGASANLAWIEVTLPRGKAPRALGPWRRRAGQAVVAVPDASLQGFLGALVHGAYSEIIEAEVELTVVPAENAGEGKRLLPLPLGGDAIADEAKLGTEERLVAAFDLPFIEVMGFEPGYEDDTVIELAFADPGRVESLTATLNGVPIEVRPYRYPREKAMWSFYIELTGVATPGPQELELAYRLKPGVDHA